MRKIRNPKANPESKTQKAKAEFLKAHPIQHVKCEKCGSTHKTLYNVGGKYFCSECKSSNA